MSYKVNPSALNAVFVVPSQVVDKHIRLASGQQLKVLLWVLRHSSDGVDIDKLSSDLHFERRDAEDYLQYWLETGVIISDSVEPAAEKPQEKPKPAPKIAQTDKIKALPEIQHARPSSEEIAARMEESPDIKYLLLATQQKLGRTIGYDGQCTILMLHDCYGLPVEVIMMIIEYAVSAGKANFHYIASVGRDWGERGIDTLEKADAQIKDICRTDKVWSEFAAAAGISNPRPTEAQAKMLKRWTGELKFSSEMIYLAYEEMSNNCRKMSFPYMNKVLENWHKDGIASAKELEEYKKERSGKTAARSEKSAAGSSYDLDEFKKRAINAPLVYNKKKKDESPAG